LQAKTSGGLGVINLSLQNRALLIKNLHKFFNRVDTHGLILFGPVTTVTLCPRIDRLVLFGGEMSLKRLNHLRVLLGWKLEIEKQHFSGMITGMVFPNQHNIQNFGPSLLAKTSLCYKQDWLTPKNCSMHRCPLKPLFNFKS
jgi:hypothetical protein